MPRCCRISDHTIRHVCNDSSGKRLSAPRQRSFLSASAIGYVCVTSRAICASGPDSAPVPPIGGPGAFLFLGSALSTKTAVVRFSRLNYLAAGASASSPSALQLPREGLPPLALAGFFVFFPATAAQSSQRHLTCANRDLRLLKQVWAATTPRPNEKPRKRVPLLRGFRLRPRTGLLCRSDSRFTNWY